MPLYEYACERCGKSFEELKSPSERDEPGICPHCGAEAQRQLSSFAMGGAGSGRSTGCAPSSGGT
jgi:putative FmdB family regulatory protein